MKILVVQETDWIQNLPLQTHHIIEFLSRKGHDVRVVDFEARWKPQDITRSVKCRVFLNIHRTDLESSVCLIRPGMVKVPWVARMSALASQFKVIFEQMKWCDVVVLYSVPTNGVQTIVSSKLLSKPVVFHSFDVLHRMTGHSLLRAPTWTLERFVYRRADKVIVISEALAKYMQEIGVPQGGIVLLPPAVDTRRFNPSLRNGRFRKSLGIGDDDKIILFSGWLYEFSGVDLVLASLKELRKDVPNVRLVVCGDGPLLEKLVQMRRELGVQEHVDLLGRRPFEQMPSIIASADVCINPYLPEVRSNFAFPSKIAEYMASGRAVVSTDLPGTKSILGNESGAVLVPPQQFVQSLRTILADSELAKRQGEKCREFCENHFSLESISQKFEDVLSQTISQWSIN